MRKRVRGKMRKKTSAHENGLFCSLKTLTLTWFSEHVQFSHYDMIWCLHGAKSIRNNKLLMKNKIEFGTTANLRHPYWVSVNNFVVKKIVMSIYLSSLSVNWHNTIKWNSPTFMQIANIHSALNPFRRWFVAENRKCNVAYCNLC